MFERWIALAIVVAGIAFAAHVLRDRLAAPSDATADGLPPTPLSPPPDAPPAPTLDTHAAPLHILRGDGTHYDAPKHHEKGHHDD